MREVHQTSLTDLGVPQVEILEVRFRLSLVPLIKTLRLGARYRPVGMSAAVPYTPESGIASTTKDLRIWH